jgi:hypothetical protein
MFDDRTGIKPEVIEDDPFKKMEIFLHRIGIRNISSFQDGGSTR